MDIIMTPPHTSGTINMTWEMYVADTTYINNKILWSDLDQEPSIKQPHHRKKQRIKIKMNQTMRINEKGIGFTELFKGNRYPIGNKK